MPPGALCSLLLLLVTYRTSAAPACPARANASSCVTGVTGPPGLPLDSFHAAFRLPPSAGLAPVPLVSGVCLSVLTSCAAVVAQSPTAAPVCPAGASVSVYFGAEGAACAATLAALSAQNVTLACGTTDCNAPAPPPAPPANNSASPGCPAASNASSCLLGVVGPNAAIEASMLAAYRLPAGPLRASPTGSASSVCFTITTPCVALNNAKPGTAGICPYGASVTVFFGVALALCPATLAAVTPTRPAACPQCPLPAALVGSVATCASDDCNTPTSGAKGAARAFALVLAVAALLL